MCDFLVDCSGECARGTGGGGGGNICESSSGGGGGFGAAGGGGATCEGTVRWAEVGSVGVVGVAGLLVNEPPRWTAVFECILDENALGPVGTCGAVVAR